MCCTCLRPREQSGARSRSCCPAAIERKGRQFDLPVSRSSLEISTLAPIAPCYSVPRNSRTRRLIYLYGPFVEPNVLPARADGIGAFHAPTQRPDEFRTHLRDSRG